MLGSGACARSSTPAPGVWSCGSRRFDLSSRPLVMGIVNLTPDSFSDGGRLESVSDAVDAGLRLKDEGADILDLGAESTRPGAAPIDESVELARLMPVLERLRAQDIAISVDTRRAAVMKAALDAGADIINDVAALRSPGALDAVLASECGVCLMHMLGEPLTMQSAPAYRDVVTDVRAFLQSRVTAVCEAGVVPARIALDPGIGFGKTLEDNLRLLSHLDVLCRLGFPILVGVSRKSMIGGITGKPTHQRLAGSVAGALAAVSKGASIVRVHDVAATVDALAVWRAVHDAWRVGDRQTTQ